MADAAAAAAAAWFQAGATYQTQDAGSNCSDNGNERPSRAETLRWAVLWKIQ